MRRCAPKMHHVRDVHEDIRLLQLVFLRRLRRRCAHFPSHGWAPVAPIQKASVTGASHENAKNWRTLTCDFSRTVGQITPVQRNLLVQSRPVNWEFSNWEWKKISRGKVTYFTVKVVRIIGSRLIETFSNWEWKLWLPWWRFLGFARLIGSHVGFLSEIKKLNSQFLSEKFKFLRSVTQSLIGKSSTTCKFE